MVKTEKEKHQGQLVAEFWAQETDNRKKWLRDTVVKEIKAGRLPDNKAAIITFLSKFDPTVKQLDPRILTSTYINPIRLKTDPAFYDNWMSARKKGVQEAKEKRDAKTPETYGETVDMFPQAEGKEVSTEQTTATEVAPAAKVLTPLQAYKKNREAVAAALDSYAESLVAAFDREGRVHLIRTITSAKEEYVNQLMEIFENES